jgi:hypothetical protein
LFFLNKNISFVCVYRCKALILELLAAVCLVELGHDVVLAAFDNFRIVKEILIKTKSVKKNYSLQECQEKHRFEILMKSFTQSLEFNVDYMVNAIPIYMIYIYNVFVL